MKQLVALFANVWKGGTPTQKAMGVLSALVVLAGASFAVYFATRPDLALLYGGLDPADAGSVVEEVRKAGVVAEVRAGGTAIYVPAARVDEMRMITSQAGLPKSRGNGWELFDQSSFGISDFVQNVNYLRAQQTELARAIEKLEVVEGATVQITRPKRSYFVEGDDAAKASVVVAVRGGRRLSADNVKAITHLVSGAVEGLAPENISVVDTKGNTLSEPGDDTLAASSSRQLEHVRDVEDHLQSQAEQLLLASGIRGTVRVGVEMAFPNVKETSEKYEPKGTVSQEVSETHTSTGGTTEAGGPASAKDQLADSVAPGNGATTSNETTETTTLKSLVGRTVRSEEIRTPTVKRMWVSLVLDEAQKDKLQQVEDIVKSAVNFDEKRGDVLKSMTSAMEAAPAPGQLEAQETSRFAPLVPLLIERGVQIAGVIGALLLLLRLLKAVDAPPRAARSGETAGAFRAGAAGPGTGTGGPNGSNGTGGAGGPGAAAGDGSDAAALHDFVRNTVRTDPASATRVLQTWLHDDRGSRN